MGVDHFVASAVAGSVSVAALHPLDTIVVHLQSGKGAPLLYRPAVLYRGATYAMLNGAACNSTMFGAYETIRAAGIGNNAAAALAGVPESLVKGPLLAMQNLKQIGVQPMLLSLPVLKGTGAMMLREVPGNVIFFGTYRYLTGPEPWQQGLAGAAAAAAFTAAVYPLDAIRVQIVTSSPLRWTYDGALLYGLRVSLLSGILFAAYEGLLKHMTE
jgi:hypothetical protein